MDEAWVDHREDELPPLWVATGHAGDRTPERLGRLYQAGPSGVMRDAIVDLIGAAREVVCLCSFLLSEESVHRALLMAAGRGVRVYVLTASREQLERMPKDEERSKDRIADHKRRLDELAGKVLVRCSNQFHAKFILTDPQRDGAQGLLSTANLNPALLNNAELGLALGSEAVKAAYGFFCKAFWSHAANELQKAGELATCVGRDFPIPEPHPRVIWTLPESTGLSERVLGMLENATSSITVAVYGLDTRHRAFRALVDQAQSGLDVTVLLPTRNKVGVAAIELAEAGVKVFGVEKLHAKAVVADDQAVVMTANLEKHGLDEGCELGVLLNVDETLELMDVLERWEALAPWRLCAATKVGLVLGPVMDPATGDKGDVVDEAEGHRGKLRWAHRHKVKAKKKKKKS
jgi:cardiolipin synthase A/B